MKRKISVSIEENLFESLEKLVDTGKFRNKSHLVEFSLNKIISEENNE